MSPSSVLASVATAQENIGLVRLCLETLEPRSRELVDWCRESMLKPDVPLASAPDLDIPLCVADAPAAVRAVPEHQAKWLRASAPAAV